MKQYIDKSALVAWIERQIDSLERNSGCSGIFGETQMAVFDKIFSFLNTLEVKEVVDAEIVEVKDDNNSIYAYTHLEICTEEDLSKICKAGDKAKVIIIKQK